MCTSFNSILNKIHELIVERTSPGDSFFVNCVFRDVNKKQTEDLKRAVIQDLKDFKLIFNEKKPNWIVQIEVVGENTGVSVLKPSEYVMKHYG